MATITVKAADLKAGMQEPNGIRYMTDPAPQPDGSVSVVIMYPSRRREIIDFPDPTTEVEVIA